MAQPAAAMPKIQGVVLEKRKKKSQQFLVALFVQADLALFGLDLTVVD